MADDNKIPSYEDVSTAFSRIRATPKWDHEKGHPDKRLVLAGEWAETVVGDCKRIAAYRLLSARPPLVYYDETIDKLEMIIEMLKDERRKDHGDAIVAVNPQNAFSRKYRDHKV